jgi:hypothetical protein
MSVLFLRNAQDNKHLPSFLFRGNLSKNSLLISLEHTSSDDETHTHLSEEEKRKLCPCVFVHSRLMTNHFSREEGIHSHEIKLRHSPNISGVDRKGQDTTRCATTKKEDEYERTLRPISCLLRLHPHYS